MMVRAPGAGGGVTDGKLGVVNVNDGIEKDAGLLTPLPANSVHFVSTQQP